jgi:hypothetical protein
MPGVVWIAMAAACVCAWAILIGDLRPQKRSRPSDEDALAASPNAETRIASAAASAEILRESNIIQ